MAINLGKRVAGISSITIDGSSYPLVDGLTWSPSTVSRETMSGIDSVHGYKELPVPGFIEGTVRDIGVRVEDFSAMTSSTVVATQANGKVIVGSLMWCVSALEVNAVEGTVTVRFEGPDVTELLG